MATVIRIKRNTEFVLDKDQYIGGNHQPIDFEATGKDLYQVFAQRGSWCLKSRPQEGIVRTEVSQAIVGNLVFRRGGDGSLSIFQRDEETHVKKKFFAFSPRGQMITNHGTVTMTF